MEVYVCLCADLTESEIVDAIDSGIDTLEDLMDETNACTGCQTCRPRVEELLEINRQD